MNQSQILTSHSHKDPMTRALKEQSTHRDISTRISIYERLGLNKPGFWIDRKPRDEERDYEPDQDFTPKLAQFNPFTPTVTPNTYEVNKSSGRKSFSGPKTQTGGGTEPTGTGTTRKLLNKGELEVMSNVAKSIARAHPWLTTSSSDLIAAEKFGTARALSQAFGAALQKDPMASMTKVATEYYFNKANAAAKAREERPFGVGMPTNFDKMRDALYQEKTQVVGNTGVQNGTGADKFKLKDKPQSPQVVKVAAGPMMKNFPGKPQINAHANSYASSYRGVNIFG